MFLEKGAPWATTMGVYLGANMAMFGYWATHNLPRMYTPANHTGETKRQASHESRNLHPH